MSGGASLLGHDDGHASGPTRDVLIADNLFRQVGYRDWGDGLWMVSTDVARLRVLRNTVLNEGTLVAAYGVRTAGFGCCETSPGPGPPGSRATVGRRASLRALFPGAVVQDNVLAGADRRAYPRRNRFPRTLRGLRRWQRLGFGARG